MSAISILDQLHLSGSIDLGDDSPLALAKLQTLDFAHLPIIGDFDKSLDSFPVESTDILIRFGPNPSFSSLSGDKASFGVNASVAASFTLLTPKQGTVFPDDFAPELKINSGQCWAGLTLKGALGEFIGGKVGAFGVILAHNSSAAFGTLVRFPESGAAMPNFRQGLKICLEKFSAPFTAEKLCAIPPGVVHTMEVTGELSLGVCYAAQLVSNPLASLNMPLNFSLDVVAGAQAAIKASIKLNGDFVIRAFPSAPGKLTLGAYKKKQTTFAVTIGGVAGVEADIGQTDLFAALMGLVLPSADLSALQLEPAQQAELSAALKACADASIAVAANAVCSASTADEAAVVYEIDLTAATPEIRNSALSAALVGDWSLLETLPGAHCLRHIVRELKERQHRLNVNLLGLYNATSVHTYLTSCAVLHDENGQIILTDKASADGLSAGVTPYAAKSDKLRAVLAESFVATVSYGAVAGKVGVKSFSVKQTFLKYKAQAGPSDLAKEVRLVRLLGVPLDNSWDASGQPKAGLGQSKLSVDVSYDSATVMRLFFNDVAAQTPYAKVTLDKIGRDTKVMLLDPAAANSAQRRLALQNDEIWNAMNENGNPTTFGRIPGIAKMDPSAIGAITADWTDIRWWSDALYAVAPKLTVVLKAAEKANGANFPADPAFLAARKDLEKALSKTAQDTKSAFSDGWDLAVMYRLASSPSVQVQVAIGWNRQFACFPSPNKIARVQTSGT